MVVGSEVVKEYVLPASNVVVASLVEVASCVVAGSFVDGSGSSRRVDDDELVDSTC